MADGPKRTAVGAHSGRPPGRLHEGQIITSVPTRAGLSMPLKSLAVTAPRSKSRSAPREARNVLRPGDDCSPTGRYDILRTTVPYAWLTGTGCLAGTHSLTISCFRRQIRAATR